MVEAGQVPYSSTHVEEKEDQTRVATPRVLV